ncbi:MAG: TolC family protein [Chlorobaculum sp.]|nr:TolC family protein [Chlorobaculum sp.]
MTKMVTRRFFALLAAGLVTCSQAEAATMKLSLDDALKIAHERNSMLKAARAKNDQADARIEQTRQGFLPKVTLSETVLQTNDPGAVLVSKLQQESAYYNFNTTPPDFGDFSLKNLNHPGAITDFQTSLQVMQPIFNKDANISRSMARSARKAQGFMTDRAVETIDLNIKKAYYGLILAKKNLDATEQSIRIMQGYSSEAARGYAAGLVTKSDKLSTEVRLAELRDQKLQIQDAIRNAEDALRTMLALGPDDTVQPVGDLNVDAKLSASKASADGRSDLKALAAFQEVTGYQHDMARAQYMPRVNAFAQQNWHDNSIFGTEGSSWTIGLNVQWNIFDGMATKGKVEEARAQAMEARYNYEAARQQSDMEIDMARRSLVTSRERIAVAGQSLNAAKVSFDFIGEQFRTGMAMSFELLMREQAWTWAKMRLNQAKYDYCIAKSELEYYSAH